MLVLHGGRRVRVLLRRWPLASNPTWLREPLCTSTCTLQSLLAWCANLAALSLRRPHAPTSSHVLLSTLPLERISCYLAHTHTRMLTFFHARLCVYMHVCMSVSATWYTRRTVSAVCSSVSYIWHLWASVHCLSGLMTGYCSSGRGLRGPMAHQRTSQQ